MSEESIFQEALAKPASERSDYLNEVCGGAPELRRRVEQLLAAHDNPDSIFESPENTAAAATVPTANLPKRLGDFEITRQIGRGGMGVVYEARQVSLNRRVALKVLSSGLGLTAKAVMRFRREAEAAAKLHHTNIVPIYATGEDGGVHFYAMELIEGPSLDQVIQHMRADGGDHDSIGDDTLPKWVDEAIDYQSKRKPVLSSSASVTGSSSLSANSGYFDAVAQMIADVADALEHAHDQGVIHRDMKPSNLLLAPDGRLSVNDFGLARMLEQPGMTMTGEFVGSPLYMSPEQITAGRAPLDHRTDIYSLGATLYELLTLQPPFPGASRDQVIGQILHKESTRPRRVNSRVPVDLETICLKAIERDPDRRYQTAQQFAADLRRFTNRYAISAKRVGLTGQLVRWTRRHPALATSVLLALLACSMALLLAEGNRRSRRRIAEMERQAELREAETKLNLAQERAFSAALAANFAEAEQHIKEMERLDAPVGRVRMLNGQIALCQGNYEKALDDLKHARELLGDSTATLALLTHAYMEAGDEISYHSHLAELRKRSAASFEEHLFKGLALQWADPAAAIVAFDQAHQKNAASPLVVHLRSRARWLYSLDTGSLADARDEPKASRALSAA